MDNITEIKIWWDSQDPSNEGWSARSYNGNESGESEPLNDDLTVCASDDELIAALPKAWQACKNITIVR